MTELNRGRPLSELDAFIEKQFVKKDDALARTVQNARTEGFPEINVSPTEGKLLYLLAKMSGAKNMLEIGTLGGYSSIWLGRALPADGKLVTLEIDNDAAEFARANISNAGLADNIDVHVGNALDILPDMEKRGEGPFDLIFIDAEKEDYPEYLDLSLKLSRPGTLILSDNVIRNGSVTEEYPVKEGHRKLAEFNRRIADDPRLESLIVPLINREIIDGIGITIVK